jgi:hypothetical protein
MDALAALVRGELLGAAVSAGAPAPWQARQPAALSSPVAVLVAVLVVGGVGDGQEAAQASATVNASRQAKRGERIQGS